MRSNSPEFEYARRLAMIMWEKYYKAESPKFVLLDDMMGVLSQIDNMLTGLERKKNDK